MAWGNSSGEKICSDCNWELQETTPRFSRRHYQALGDVIDMTIDMLENAQMTKARKEASAETLTTLVDVFCNYASQDNPNFNEKMFRNQINTIA